MKDKSSNEKATLYIALFFIAFLVVVLVLYLFGVIGGKPKTVDVVLDKDIMIEYAKGKWSKVSPKTYDEYHWNKFYVYEEGQEKGKFSLYISDDKFYLFKEENKQRTPISTVEQSVYLGGKKKSSFVEFKKEEITDDDTKYINSVLTKNGVSSNDLNNYIKGYKVISDFDNDNEKEEMFVLYNVFSDEIVDTGYSLIFIKDNNKTNIIYKNVVSRKNAFSQCAATLLGLVKIDGVDSMQIITECSYYSYSNNNEYGIFQNRYNTYELLLYIK